MIICQTQGLSDTNLFYVEGNLNENKLNEVVHFFDSHRIHSKTWLISDEPFTNKLSELFHFDEIQTSLDTSLIPSHSDILILHSKSTAFVNQLRKRTQPNMLRVNLDAVVHNYAYFDQLVGAKTQMIPVLKGKGQRIIYIGKHFETINVPYQAIALIDEGVALRQSGVKSRIIVLQPYTYSLDRAVKYDLEPLFFSMKGLKELLNQVKRSGKLNYPIHLRLETGLNLYGFIKEELPELIDFLNENRDFLKVSTILSHLSSSEDFSKRQVTKKQADLFEEMRSIFNSTLLDKPKYHLLNTCGTINFPEYHYDYCRFGKGWQGYTTFDSPIDQDLLPIATLTSVVCKIKTIQPGEGISYSQNFITDRLTRIGVIPIGFADFPRRSWSKEGFVMINGKEAKIIGSICMDSMAVDLTDVPCQEGDIVEIFGEHIKVEDMSETLQTVPSELLTCLSTRVNRIYFSNIG